MQTQQGLSSLGFSVRLASNEWVLERWEEFRNVMQGAFSNCTYNESDPSKCTPIEETHFELNDPTFIGCQHTVALDADDKIIGAYFFTTDPKCDKIADPGWFFTAPGLSRDFRRAVAGDMMHFAHAKMREAGYERIETYMGTKAGANFLQSFGYELQQGTENIWTKDLTNEA